MTFAENHNRPLSWTSGPSHTGGHTELANEQVAERLGGSPHLRSLRASMRVCRPLAQLLGRKRCPNLSLRQGAASPFFLSLHMRACLEGQLDSDKGIDLF